LAKPRLLSAEHGLWNEMILKIIDEYRVGEYTKFIKLNEPDIEWTSKVTCCVIRK